MSRNPFQFRACSGTASRIGRAIFAVLGAISQIAPAAADEHRHDGGEQRFY
jgi:hypothetical protein